MSEIALFGFDISLPGDLHRWPRSALLTTPKKWCFTGGELNKKELETDVEKEETRRARNERRRNRYAEQRAGNDVDGGKRRAASNAFASGPAPAKKNHVHVLRTFNI